MAVNERDLYKQLTQNLSSVKLSVEGLSKPDPTVEDEITKIFTQARQHRNRLVHFYIWYTVLFTILVFILIFWQARTRLYLRNTDFELVPQWALNILVAGMFAQFVGLLTIVTQRVWDFKPFFTHHMHMKTNTKMKEDDDENDEPR